VATKAKGLIAFLPVINPPDLNRFKNIEGGPLCTTSGAIF